VSLLRTSHGSKKEEEKPCPSKTFTKNMKRPFLTQQV
jgi:hypothetical protein